MITKNKSRTRVDEALVEMGLCDSIKQAQSFVMSGIVFLKTERIDNSDFLIKNERKEDLRISKKNKFKSRAGNKLEEAIEYFDIDVKDKVILDIGSSTGGFIDCLLKNNAKFVYGVEVGTNQLDYSLRINPAVKVFEKTNYLNLNIKLIEKKIDMITVDISFASSKNIFKWVKDNFTDKDSLIIFILIKPQFEIAYEKKDIYNGKIDSKIEVQNIVNHFIEVASTNNFELVGIKSSSTLGKIKKNQEVLSLWKKK